LNAIKVPAPVTDTSFFTPALLLLMMGRCARPTLNGCWHAGRKAFSSIHLSVAKLAGLFRAACRMGLEGLVSKRRDRPYQAGRSKHWVNVKNRQHPAMSLVMDSFYVLNLENREIE
jgi:hypothetical protein